MHDATNDTTGADTANAANAAELAREQAAPAERQVHSDAEASTVKASDAVAKDSSSEAKDAAAGLSLSGRAEPAERTAGDRMNFLERRCLAFLRMVVGDSVDIISQCDYLPGRPDLVIPKLALVVMVDGIFWHPGRGQKMRRVAIRFLADSEPDRADFWFAKAATNERRDREVNRQLRELGYKVVRLKEERLREGAKDPLGYVAKSLGFALSSAAAEAAARRRKK